VCPYCYNYPTLEGSKKHLGCNQCPHPTCQHAVSHYAICECPECGVGVLVLDPNSGPKWKSDCNACQYQLKLISNVYSIVPTRDCCEDCGSTLLEVNFNKKDTPLEDGKTEYTGCIKCDEFLNSRLEGGGFSKSKHPMFRSSRGRGRGRGRRGGRRGRGRRGRDDGP